MKKIIKAIYTIVCLAIFCLLLVSCNNDDYNQEIARLQEEVNNLKEASDNKEQQLKDKESSLSDKNEEIENKTKEVEELLKDLEDKEKELEDALNNNEITKEELNILKDTITELELLITQNNSVINDKQNQIDSLLTSNKLDSECINIISKILSTGISLDEYLLFKENNQKVKDDEDLKELLDRIYYYNNKDYSINYFKEVIYADGFEIATFVTSSNFTYAVTFDIEDSLVDEVVSSYNNYIYEFIFYKSEADKKVALDNYYLLDNKVTYLEGYNFVVGFSKLTDENWVMKNELSKAGEYIISAIESGEYVDPHVFEKTLQQIKEENNYQYTTSIYQKDYLLSNNYQVTKNGNSYISIEYLDSENNLEALNYRFYASFMGEEYRKKEYMNMYFFGRIVIYIVNNPDREQFMEEFKNTNLYKIISEYGVNGLDIYNQNKKAE